MSSSYKALTRIYRPQTFDDIVSQEHVSNTLKNAIANNRLSHAYLFCGPRGVGKTTMARVLARTVNEVDKNIGAEELNNTLNIVEIDAASNNSVDDVRSLRERVRIPPQSGRYKIYIVDEVHMLSKQAFNALLKTLEEPPEHVIFIFATTEPHRILPTILSRCQRFDFRRIKIEEIVTRLNDISKMESIDIDNESLHVIAKRADGALRDALGILDQAIAFCGTSIKYEDLHRALNMVSSESMFELTEAINRNDPSAGMALLHNLLHTGNDILEFLGALTEHFRNLYLAKDTQNFYLIEATDETKDRFKKTSGFFSNDDLMRMMHIVHEAQFSIRNAQQPRIHLEITLLKLFHMARGDSLKELLSRLATLEKNIVTGKLDSVTPSGFDDKSEKATPSTDTKKSKPAPSQKTSSQTPFDRNTSATPGNAPPETGGESDIFGTPTFRRPQNHLSAVALPGKTGKTETDNRMRGNLALSTEPIPASQTIHKGANSSVLNDSELKHASSLEEVQDFWPDYLQHLQAETSNMLSFSIQRTRPVALDEGVITLECNDSFTQDLIREQQRKLSKIAREHLGYAIRFTSRLVEYQKRTDTVEDPYAHFSKLQKSDPKLKQLIELFGAELEY
ncbi:MAG: DNA polymerase III subunit gamma/tau [Balneolales bacterium]